MHHNKFILLFFISFLLLTSCLDDYTPSLNNQNVNKYVIYGNIRDDRNTQKIYISKSTEVTNLKREGVSNCDVKIIDDDGNIFQFTESDKEKGCYLEYIDSQYLQDGSRFKLNVVTPEGDLITSEFEELNWCPDIDSVYYRIEEELTSNPDITIPIVQFYIDYDGANTQNKLIKIDFEETWEYHADFPLKWYYNGWYGVYELSEPDYSKKVCWRTKRASRFYLLSTEDLVDNKYKHFPLHSIPNTSERLAYGYSLLIRQSAISKKTSEYFQKLNANIIKEGSLYNTQPQQLEGNLININNPDQKVLGYFYTSGVQEKRIFIDPIEDFPLEYSSMCEPIRLDLGPYILKGAFAYLWYFDDEPGIAYKLLDSCVDCTALGGVTTKPDFWPY